MNGLQKFYIGLWSTFALVTVGLAVTGSMTMLAATVLGFVCFGLVFMGMMCVLPSTVHAHAIDEPEAPTKAKAATPRTFPIKEWFSPVGIDMRQVNHRR